MNSPSDLENAKTAQTGTAFQSPSHAAHSPGGRNLFFLVILIGFGALVWQFGIAPRIRAAAETRRNVSHPQVRTVSVTRPIKQPVTTEILLPATAQALQQTTLYAQTAGYLKRWLVDLGDSVKKGQLLAELDTPQVDQQLAQTRASLEQAEANLKLAETTADRWKELAAAHAASRQETDEKFNAANVARASRAAARATLEQLTALEQFKKIYAPFDGTITSRTVEIGALISVGSNPTEMFRIVQADRLRFFANVPQAYMRSVQIGMKVDGITREFGSRIFPGTVTRTTKMIDPASRTLLTEIDIPNQDGSLLPGMYAQMRFKLINPEPIVLVPSSAVVVRSSGPMVAVVDDGNHYTYHKVHLGRDLGAQIEIEQGLQPTDRVVLAPMDDITEGAVVDVLGESTAK